MTTSPTPDTHADPTPATGGPTRDAVVPAVVEQWFEVLRHRRPGVPGEALAVTDLLAEGVQVTDDGQTHRGRDEVARWLAGPATQYQVTWTRLGVETTSVGVVVTTRLEGDFPGGVVVLRHVFELDAAGRIAVLTISA